MNPGVAQRLAKTVLRQLGQDGLFRGATPCRANVEHDVEVAEGQGVFTRTIVTLDKSLAAKRNDTLAVGAIVDGVFVPSQQYVIDGPPITDNGVLQRFAVRVA